MLKDHPATAVVPTHDIAAARSFFADSLGLDVIEEQTAMGSIVFGAGGGTQVLVYQTSVKIPAEHTICSFEVDDVEGAVADLEARGVVFEEYDLADFGFPDGGRGKVIELPDGGRSAWFKDREGNILNIWHR